MRFLLRSALFLALLLSILSLPAFADGMPSNDDFLSGNDWPMADAQAQIAGMIGTARVYELTIDRDSITLSVDHPIDPRQLLQYTWNRGGVHFGPSIANDFALPNPFVMSAHDSGPFGLGELDFASLLAVKAAALAAVTLEGATITEIEGSKPYDFAGETPLALWTVHLADAEGQTVDVLLSSSAQVVDVFTP
jgi:hypothetical protein